MVSKLHSFWRALYMYDSKRRFTVITITGQLLRGVWMTPEEKHDLMIVNCFEFLPEISCLSELNCCSITALLSKLSFIWIEVQFCHTLIIFQNPYSYGSSIPVLHFDWTASNPDSAELKSVYHRWELKSLGSWFVVICDIVIVLSHIIS
jgi:hypothetical protein